MIKNLCCIELSQAKVAPIVLHKFDCGHPDFNEFLANDALRYGENGEGITYLLVDKKEQERGSVESVVAFMTIQTTAMYYNNGGIIYSIPAAEIKYFAIAKQLQRETAYLIDNHKYYSTVLFEKFLLELYLLSIRTIGFRALFLRANKNGERLYRRKSFVDADNYIIPYSEDDPLGECVPLVLFIQENLYSIFGAD